MDRLYDLLKQKVGMTAAEIHQYFVIEETEKEWILKLVTYLEPTTYKALRELCEERGGAYQKSPQPTFYIPKMMSQKAEPSEAMKNLPVAEQIPNGAVITVPLSRVVAGKFNVRKFWSPEAKQKLKESMRLHKRNLTPIAVRPHPEEPSLYQILGGHLRYQVAKELGFETIDVRVFYPQTEAEAWSIAFAEEIKEPWTVMAKARAVKALKDLGLEVKEIARIALETEENVYNLLRLMELPEEVQNLIDFGKLPHSFGLDLLQLKDKPDKLIELAKKASEHGWTVQKLRDEISKILAPSEEITEKKFVTSRKEISPISEKKPVETILNYASKMVRCENCNLLTLTPKEWHGHMLCPICYEKAEQNPELFMKKLKPEPKPAKVEVKKLEKPKEKPEYRKAIMQPQVSQMELAVAEELAKRGLSFETQKQFCVQSCIADFYFPKQRLAVFLDGPPHKGREDRDEAFRELLWKRHNIEPLTIEYESYTKQQVQEIVELILQALEERQ